MHQIVDLSEKKTNIESKWDKIFSQKFRANAQQLWLSGSAFWNI